eukprot:12978941-Alexandrium_andersonii.AAC.1
MFCAGEAPASRTRRPTRGYHVDGTQWCRRNARHTIGCDTVQKQGACAATAATTAPAATVARLLQGLRRQCWGSKDVCEVVDPTWSNLTIDPLPEIHITVGVLRPLPVPGDRPIPLADPNQRETKM